MTELGGSGVEASALGFGAAGIGNLYAEMSEEQAYRAVQAARRSGICCFGTAAVVCPNA